MHRNFTGPKSGDGAEIRRGIGAPALLALGTIIGLALLVPGQTYLAGHIAQSLDGQNPVLHGVSGLVTTKLFLPVEKADMKIEQHIGIRNPTWTAGPVRPAP